MNELITKLADLGFTPEKFAEESNSYNEGISDYTVEEAAGKWKKVLEEELDDSQDYSWQPTKVIVVLYFEKYNTYIRSDMFSGSYGRETWTDWKQCFPRQVVTTRYEYEDSQLNSY